MPLLSDRLLLEQGGNLLLEQGGDLLLESLTFVTRKRWLLTMKAGFEFLIFILGFLFL